MRSVSLIRKQKRIGDHLALFPLLFLTEVRKKVKTCYNMANNMKTIISLFLVTGLLFIAFFGLSALEHSMGHKQSNCAISFMSSAPCPTNIASVMNHHISAIQSLFNVPLDVFFFSIILLVTVSIIWFAYLFKFLLLRSQFLTKGCKITG